MKPSPDLLALASLYGVQTAYLDMRHRRHEADADSLLLILKALGAELENAGGIAAALRARREQLARRKAAPVQVAWDGKLGAERFDAGYHVREVNGQEVFIIAAPRKAFSPLRVGENARKRRPAKAWGIFAPVYALHSTRNRNAGDITDFSALIDWMADFGGRIAATLPLLAAFLDEPFEPSPYAPASRLFWNEFYIDPSRVPEFQSSFVPRPRRKRFIDYREEMAFRRKILESMAKRFFRSGDTPRRAAFEEFRRAHTNLDRYAQFRAITDRQRMGWHAWPPRLRNGNIRSGDFDRDTKNYHLYSQWIIQQQISDLSKNAAANDRLLYLDLPLGLHTDSFDVWHDREFFVQGVAGGAPPDPVFTKGQNWGFPPMNPEAIRLNKHQYMIAYIRNHLQFARLLRLDHVMGLHRLFWIPDGLDGSKGVYVEYPAEELYAILSLESHLCQAGIVGENLGTVPPVVNRFMHRHNIQEMYVVQYEIAGDPNRPTLRRPPRNSVASLNTHDMPPFQAFLDGLDIEDRHELNFLDDKGAREERRLRAAQKKAFMRFLETKKSSVLFRDIMKFLSDSAANIVLVNVEDLWRETLPQNVPATNNERPNWRRRIKPTIEQIRRMRHVAKVLTDVFAERS